MAAVRDGFIKSTANVEVPAPGTYRVDFLLAAEHVPAIEAKTSSPAAEPSMSAVVEELAAMKERLAATNERIAQLETALRARTTPGEGAALSGTPAAMPMPATQGAASPVAAMPAIPEALQSPETSTGVDNFTPFAYGDFTWLNGTPRNKDTVLDTKYFTPEVRFDTHFIEDTNQPKDHSMGGATESFRSGEFQVEQISVGGDFHWQNVRGRILTPNLCTAFEELKRS